MLKAKQPRERILKYVTERIERLTSLIHALESDRLGIGREEELLRLRARLDELKNLREWMTK